MKKLVVLEHITIDGVIQAPGGTEEDTSSGFAYGGWISPFSDEILGASLRKQMNTPFDLLLGRKTFEIWESYWPQHTDIWPAAGTATIYISLVCEALRGPINTVSPNPVTNFEFTDTLARILGCKPRLAFPAWMMWLMLVEMADAPTLASRRIEPRRLLEAEYSFRFPDLDTALRHELAGNQLV